ncbi:MULTISPECIES: lysine--tRNA ligase [unclassified Mycoplasma]|uniref:lysine--tRNA ligase n=1 Tax=unclassified Mycoplasma TaxID=2683645 RepID=UPI00211C8EA2|nr:MULTISPECIES: lysine--tRNA ligase [unclassified Mycoplasma]UUM19781.1 lysine--tRNA ligase [Mycoplasma sp. 1578d]UUM24764.1 lysine--tRNA ligase [Mycoplasma sp. 3686d]
METKLSEQEQIRRNKLKHYQQMGINPFVQATQLQKLTYSNQIIEQNLEFTKEQLEQKEIPYAITGRILTMRGPFILIKDYHGKIQVYFNKKQHQQLAELVDTFDLGDIIYVQGIAMKTHTGEVTLKAKEIKLLSKALKPLPDKYHGLSDVEERYRHRYVDLIVNPDSVNTFWTRSKIISAIRSYFDNLEYMEVETPFLHDYLSGASAKPFKTHHNALDQDYFLRIATEIPLKKLLVGGIDRVYEIGKIFRNEGIDTTHNPEFTSIEFYEAYSNLQGMMERTEELIKSIAYKLNKQKVINRGVEIDLTKPFNRINMIDAVSKATGTDFRNISFEQAVQIAQKHNIKVEKFFKLGHIINELFEVLIEQTLIQPTFVYGHPIEISPLTAKSQDPRFTERAELFINTKEYANMYTELSDPIDQLERFKEQLNEKNNGNDEASDIDWDFVEALEYGFPPAGGCGIGIDRITMLLTEKDSIRDVLLFPTMKRKLNGK